MVRDLERENAGCSDIWCRYTGPEAVGSLWQKMLLAYISDAAILQSAVKPHGITYGDEQARMSTMNHSMWFHRPFSASDWLLLHSTCSSTGSGRALSIAEVYTEAGELACTISQQASMQRVG
jgi:acyl-CoA thioesterase II